MCKHLKYLTGKVFILATAMILFIVGSAYQSHAQAKLSASISSASVSQNTSFQITYSLTGGKAESFTPPSCPGLTMIGSSHSSGGGVTMYLNGQKIQSGANEETWVYTMTGATTDKITIGPAKVKVNGQWISSASLAVEITQGTAKQNQGNKNQTQGGQSTQQGQDGSISIEDVFLKAYVDKNNPMQGEQITVTYKIYTRIPISQYAINKLSAFTGFWTQDLNKDQGSPVQYNETVNGIRYTVAEIRKVALFPQKTGKLTIDPIEVECIARVKVRGTNNPFNSVKNVRHTLKSNSVTVSVSPLPETNKPEGFAGAVGSFTFSAETGRSKVKQNEAFTLKLAVKGSGNISLVELPIPAFPSDFEVYDPQITEDIVKNSNPVSGSKTFEYLIIPRNAGDFKLPALTFSYYDTKSRSYKSITVPEMQIIVEKGTGSAQGGNQGASPADVEIIGNDVRYANVPILPLSRIGYQFFNSLMFYLIVLIPVILFAVFLVIWRRKIKLRNDLTLLKNVQATRVARKRLAEAEKHLKDSRTDAFYEEVSKALWGYVSDKFAIPLSDLSLDTVKERLSEKQVSAEVYDKLTETLNHCEYARFAPAGSTPDMGQVYADATSVIVDLEKELQLKRTGK